MKSTFLTGLSPKSSGHNFEPQEEMIFQKLQTENKVLYERLASYQDMTIELKQQLAKLGGKYQDGGNSEANEKEKEI